MSTNFALSFTNHAKIPNPRVITKAERWYLYDKDGVEIFDAQCGNVCCTLGYSQHDILDAAVEYARRVPFSRHNNGMLCDMATSYSARLATKFDGYNHFFFGNSGSDAVETSIRMCDLYWKAQGVDKTQVVSFKDAYHGSTWLTSTLGDLIHDLGYAKINGVKLSSPYKTPLAQIKAEIEALDASKIMAVVLEPFSYTRGLLSAPTEFWEFIGSWCEKNNVLMVLDEVASGFAKTGSMFYYTQLGVRPDVIALGKTINAGYAPLSASAISDKLWSVLENTILFHGWTFNGSAFGLAAANKTMDIFDAICPERMQGTPRRLSSILEKLKGNLGFDATRQIGCFFAVDFCGPSWSENAGNVFQKVCRDANIQLTTYERDRTARGLVPLNADDDYWVSFEQKLTEVFTDPRLR